MTFVTIIKWLAAFAAVAALTALAVFQFSRADVRAAHARLAADRQSVQTRLGPIAFERGGSGPVVLVLHGAGGGHDQGRLIAEALIGDGVAWIAPSRFGYPGTPMPADASTAAQADALAALLDALALQRVAVIGFSGGVPPALQLALRHPERVDRLVLMSSAPFTPFTPEVEGRAVPAWVYRALLANDSVYWLLTKLASGTLREAFDARPALLETASAAERAFVDRMITEFLPPSTRAAGIVNEAAAVAPDARYPLQRITAPTLVLHARDDRLNPVAVAEALAKGLPRAETRYFGAGGHLLLGHHEAVRAAVGAYVAPRARVEPPVRVVRHADGAPGRPVCGAEGASRGIAQAIEDAPACRP